MDVAAFAKHAADRLLIAAGGLLLSAAAGIATPARGQCPPEWVQRFDVPAARVAPAMAYDSRREVVVLLGGDNNVGLDDHVFRQLWEWDGQQWNRRADVVGGPQGRLSSVDMAYDSWRGVTVLRVRRTPPAPPETWEFDGQNWSLRATGGPTGPDVSMTFDSWRGVTVLWGENGVGTWEWNGASWSFRDAGPFDALFELAFDENRGVTVAFGQLDVLAQTWEWDGQGWRQAFVGGPPVRSNHGMAYDPALKEVVMFGGGFVSVDYDDTWAWNGSSWRFVTQGEPSERVRHGMAYDAARGEIVVFAGQPDFNSHFSDTWTFDGDSWTLADEGEPAARESHGLSYDRLRKRFVLFGGASPGTAVPRHADTWEHDGQRWRSVPATGPAARYGHSMVYDESQSITILFGGSVNEQPVADMWTWDGEEWLDITSPGPSPRMLAAMVYDSDRQTIVLFGGYDGNAALGDTWEYSNGKWMPRSTFGPLTRYYAHAGYDRERREVVLFGGFSFPAREVLGDTWTWNGNAWIPHVVSGPSRRLDGAFDFSQALGVCVLFGGRRDNIQFDDTWVWTGASWLEWQFAPFERPLPRSASRMADSSRPASVFLHGGYSLFGDAWELARPVASKLGDLNCDCAIDSFDIEPFILALVDPHAYAAIHPNCMREFADMNNDGRIDVFDIEPFVDALIP